MGFPKEKLYRMSSVFLFYNTVVFNSQFKSTSLYREERRFGKSVKKTPAGLLPVKAPLIFPSRLSQVDVIDWDESWNWTRSRPGPYSCVCNGMEAKKGSLRDSLSFFSFQRMDRTTMEIGRPGHGVLYKMSWHLTSKKHCIILWFTFSVQLLIRIELKKFQFYWIKYFCTSIKKRGLRLNEIILFVRCEELATHFREGHTSNSGLK